MPLLTLLPLILAFSPWGRRDVYDVYFGHGGTCVDTYAPREKDLLGGGPRRRSTSSIPGVVHPCSRLPQGETARSMVANCIPEPGGLFPHPALRVSFSRTREKESLCGLRPGSWVGRKAVRAI